MSVSGDAIAGFVGVLVGGGITTAGTVWLERQRSRERVAEQNASARSAARVLAAELDSALGNLKAFLAAGKWLDDPERALTTDMWVEKRSAVAIESFVAWDPVEDAFALIDQIRRVEVAYGTKKGDPIQPKMIPEIERRLKMVEIARTALRDYANVPPFEHEGYQAIAREIEEQAKAGGWNPQT